MLCVMVGVFGGVDFLVVVWCLVQQGEVVVGLFMQNWVDDGSGDCCVEDDCCDVVVVCGLFGILFYFWDFFSEYWQGVFEYFLVEYVVGCMLNLDVLCNCEVKFKYFLDVVCELGVECIVIGYYVWVIQCGYQWLLLCGVDCFKDQSYFLYQLGQE